MAAAAPLSRARRTDVGIAAAASVLATLGVWQEVVNAPRHQPPAAFAYLLGVAAGLPLLWRRDRPLVAGLGCLGVVAVYHVAGYSGGAPAMASFVAVYSLAAAPATRGSLPLAVAIGLATAAVLALPPNPVPPGNGAVYGPALGLVIVAFVGDAARRRNEEMTESIDRLDRLRREEARRRIAEERLTIARELHDIVAHTIAVITVQAGVADDALAGRPDEARAALRVIREAARDATRELRTTVGVLRSADDAAEGEAPPSAPAPGLDDLDELLARLPGMTIDVHVTGEDRSVPRTVATVAYRIIQEALTNVLRHSGCRAATVDLRYEPRELVVQITDRGQGPAGDRQQGFGLAGMGERAAAVDGTVTAGPVPTGGFQVVARLPLVARR